MDHLLGDRFGLISLAAFAALEIKTSSEEGGGREKKNFSSLFLTLRRCRCHYDNDDTFCICERDLGEEEAEQEEEEKQARTNESFKLMNVQDEEKKVGKGKGIKKNILAQ